MQCVDKRQQVFGRRVANVIHGIGRQRQTVLAVLLLRGSLHDAHHTLDNVIDVGKIAFAVAVVEDLDGLALHQLVGKAEISHIGTTGGTVDSEET